jgi:acetate kinase
MKVLVINCGSSTLKFHFIEVDNDAASDRQRRLARGTVDGIGGRGAIEFVAADGEAPARNPASIGSRRL